MTKTEQKCCDVLLHSNYISYQQEPLLICSKAAKPVAALHPRPGHH